MNDASQRLSPAELKTLFLFESLNDDQLDWLSRNGYVQSWSAGETVYAEGEPATCFFVLLSGTLSMHRQVENTDVETTRTDQRGVYAGATSGLRPGVGPRALPDLGAGGDRLHLLDDWRRRVRRPDPGVVPDGHAHAGGLDGGHAGRPGPGRPAGTAALPGPALGRADPRAEQSSRRRGAGHRDPAGAGEQDARQAGPPGHLRHGPEGPGGADRAAGDRRGADGQGGEADPEPGRRRRGRAHRLAGRPRHRRRLGPCSRSGRGRRTDRVAGRGGRNGARRRCWPTASTGWPTRWRPSS